MKKGDKIMRYGKHVLRNTLGLPISPICHTLIPLSTHASYHNWISSFLYTRFGRSTIKSFAARTDKSTQNCCRLHLLQTLYSLRGLRSLQELWILRCTVLRRNKKSQRTPRVGISKCLSTKPTGHLLLLFQRSNALWTYLTSLLQSLPHGNNLV